MTTKQHRLYILKWSEVRKQLRETGYTAKEADGFRDELTVRALGKYKSSKAFTTLEFNKVLREFQTITEPDNIDPQMQDDEDLKKRALVAAISQSGFAAGYIETVLERRFESTPFEDLDSFQLHQLLMTLKTNARSRAKKHRKSHAKTG